MAAQKHKEKVFEEIFYIFERLLTQNPTNKDSQLSLSFRTIWRNVTKSKHRGLWGIISA